MFIALWMSVVFYLNLVLSILYQQVETCRLLCFYTLIFTIWRRIRFKFSNTLNVVSEVLLATSGTYIPHSIRSRNGRLRWQIDVFLNVQSYQTSHYFTNRIIYRHRNESVVTKCYSWAVFDSRYLSALSQTMISLSRKPLDTVIRLPRSKWRFPNPNRGVRIL